MSYTYFYEMYPIWDLIYSKHLNLSWAFGSICFLFFLNILSLGGAKKRRAREMAFLLL